MEAGLKGRSIPPQYISLIATHTAFPFSFFFLFFFKIVYKRERQILIRFRKIFFNKVNQPIKAESKIKFWLMRLMTIHIIRWSNSQAFWLIEFPQAAGHSVWCEFQPGECFYFILICKKCSKLLCEDALRKLALWSVTLFSCICAPTLKIFLLNDTY